MKVLYHRDKVMINDRKGYIFTVAGYARQYGDNVEKVVNKEKELGRDLYSVSQRIPMLTNDKEFNRQENEKWANPIVLEDGEIVEIDGDKLKVVYKGNYSDMAHLKPVK